MVVIDTSVAYKFFAPEEEGYLQASNILQKHIEGNEIILVPDLLLYELANAWSTKTSVSSIQIAVNLNDLKVAKLEVENVSFQLVDAAVKLSREYKISVYDGYFAVLAKKKKCDLVTADNQLADKLRMPFVKKLTDYE